MVNGKQDAPAKRETQGWFMRGLLWVHRVIMTLFAIIALCYGVFVRVLPDRVTTTLQLFWRRASQEEIRQTWGQFQVMWIKNFFRAQQDIFSINVIEEHKPSLAYQGPLLIIATHASWFDHILGMHLAYNFGLKDLRVALKDMMRFVPILGPINQACGSAFLRRGGDPHDKMRMRESLDLTASDRASFAFYPEGTRSPDRHDYLFIGRPHRGGFNIACERLPNHPVLIIDMDWMDRENLRVLTDTHGLFGANVYANCWIEPNPGKDGADAFLDRVWRKIDRNRARRRGVNYDEHVANRDTRTAQEH